MKNRVLVNGINLVLVTLFCFPANSEIMDGEELITVLPVILVTGFRIPGDVMKETVSYELIPAGQDINQATGINLFSNGPAGQNTSLFMRGTNSDHTLLAIDGVAIQDHSSLNGADDFGQHSLVGINTVEIIKGPMGSTYGPNAVAGVINFVTIPTTEKSIATGIGSYGIKRVNLKYGLNISNSTTASLNYIDNSSTGISIFPGGSEVDGYRNRGISLLTETQLGQGLKIRTTMIKSENKADMDTGTADDPNYLGEWTWENLGATLENNNNKLTLNNSSHKRSYINNGDIEHYNSKELTALGSHTFRFVKTNFTVGGEHKSISADLLTEGSWITSVDKSRTVNGIFLNGDHAIGRVILQAGARADLTTDFGRYSTFRLAGNFNQWRVSAATGYRLPSIYEMYGLDNYGFSGNSQLGSERSRSNEIGYRKGRLDVALFSVNVTNEIVYKTDPATFASTYSNDTSGISHSKGVEAKYGLNLFGLDIINNLTYLHARNSAGAEKLRQPSWKNNLSVTARAADNLTVRGSMTYISGRKDIDNLTYTTINQGNIILFNIDSVYQVTKKTNFYSKVLNLTNVNYQLPMGYQQYGRTVEVGLKINF